MAPWRRSLYPTTECDVASPPGRISSLSLRLCAIIISTLLLERPQVTNASLSYDTCDSNALPAASTRASYLTPNRFHKLCPGIPTSSSKASKPLSHPQCGDGTPFAFFYTRPIKRKINTNRILIEFMGGGACWDSTTCGLQKDQLTFPYLLDNFIGLGCSEIEAGLSSRGGDDGGNGGDGENGRGNGNKYPISMLCSKSVGGVDFAGYNTLVIPYCVSTWQIRLLVYMKMKREEQHQVIKC